MSDSEEGFKSSDYDSSSEELCGRCHEANLEGDYNMQKDCFKCNKTVCINCVAVTSCQTDVCECLDCWDPICERCGENLDQYLPDGVFPLVDDAEEYTQYFYCPDCWTKIQNGEESDSDSNTSESDTSDCDSISGSETSS